MATSWKILKLLAQVISHKIRTAAEANEVASASHKMNKYIITMMVIKPPETMSSIKHVKFFVKNLTHHHHHHHIIMLIKYCRCFVYRIKQQELA